MSRSLSLDFDAMRQIDIRTIDPASLEDIRETKVDPAKPLPERMLSFIKQIKNPYCFRCGDMVIKISHVETEITMEERMEGFFRAL